MRWIVDTSAWARRRVPAITRQFDDMLAVDGTELLLSPTGMLELMRGPQDVEVAAERRRLTAGMELLGVDDLTFQLAAGAMERLALHQPQAHRLPLADLITAALAHQHDCGVVHIDRDFELLASESGLALNTRELQLPSPHDQTSASPGMKQRALKKELAQLLHQMPIADAEGFLEASITSARARLREPREDWSDWTDDDPAVPRGASR